MILPPGRFRLGTRPAFTGSSPAAKTIGIVVVAALRCIGGQAVRNDYVDRTADKLCRHCGQSRQVILSVAGFNDDVPALNETDFRKALAQGHTEAREWHKRGAPEEANHRHSLLLRPRPERPHRRRAANRSNELPPPHSITSSARANSVAGTVMPSTRAVLRLMASSNLVGCKTGRSLGFSPFNMRPLYAPA